MEKRLSYQWTHYVSLADGDVSGGGTEIQSGGGGWRERLHDVIVTSPII